MSDAAETVTEVAKTAGKAAAGAVSKAARETERVVEKLVPRNASAGEKLLMIGGVILAATLVAYYVLGIGREKAPPGAA